MKFATFLYQISGPDMVAMAQRAEQLGFESLWIPDHIVLPTEYRSTYPYAASGRMPAPPETPFHDPMLALAYIAGVTRTIRLATGVLVLPMRNPFAVAKAVATLDVVSNGRAILGVGIGWLREEFTAIGMDFDNRARRTREAIALMKQLWTSETPSFHGQTVSAENLRFAPKPLQKPHPPIVLGGDSEPSLKRAAQVGDGWYGIMPNIEAAADTIARLRKHETAVGRATPLEITVNPRLAGPLDIGQIRRLEAIGVDRVILNVGRGAKDARAEIERFHDAVIAKL
ncbi:MAG: LLM class F420-dependent oxidoreductase [Candidatus Binataceae bacterium]|nr:LLM class F420-dependent oxidoreductase [Candidatus Binataceae bacterium]